MRLAIISDIHSNLEALTRALLVIDQHHVDEIYCIGDVVGYGANPNECLDLVRERCSVILLGNHDKASVDLFEAADFTLHARLAIEWTARALANRHKEFIRSLPLTAQLDDLFFVHASPYQPEQWHYVISDMDTEAAFECFTQRLCFIGHTHVAHVFPEEQSTQDRKGAPRAIINVGSIGQPRDSNPKLSFGLIDTVDGNYQNIRTEYDNRTAAQKIIQAGLPRILGERLLRGV